MLVFEIFLLSALAIALIAFVILWDSLQNGLHVPYDDADINWPIDHPMYTPRDHVKRLRDTDEA